MDTAYLILGLVLLVFAGDALVRGAVALSLRLGIPALIVSATVVAFGTSAPELLISVQAALEGAPGIALGNVVGSNIANLLLVLGLPALLSPIAATGRDTERNLYLMLGATALFSALAFTGVIRWWGGLLLFALALFLVWDSVRISRTARRSRRAEAVAETEAEAQSVGAANWKIALAIVGGLIGLPLGAHLLIAGARGIALHYGVSEAVVGLTVVAIGTSLPELATTVMAALRRQADVVMGNVIGSNIFNVTAIIGAAAMTAPLPVPAEILDRDLAVMIGASLLLAPLVLMHIRIGRRVGTVFLLIYFAYIYFALSG